jgi:hypothetical protein
MHICGECDIEMKCSKTGVLVAPKSQPTWVRSGDKFECPECGSSVIVNFGEPFESFADVLFA